MEPADSSSPPPDWLTLPDNVSVAIFDFLSPGKLLFLRQVCTQWQRLAEASAHTRDKLILMQCETGNCRSLLPMLLIIPDIFFFHHDLNADGTEYDKIEDSQIALNVTVNGLRCRSFNWKKAQLLARLFPRISHFTVSHKSISSGHIDQIIYLLAQWSPTLRIFKFNSDYTLENPNKRLTRSLAVATASPPTETYLNSQLTRLFRQLKSLPELKHLTLHYRKGKINSTIGDFAFLPRLEELQLDRESLEANFQAACQRYLAPPVPGAPQVPVLRRFAHNMYKFDTTAIEFTRYLHNSPDTLPLVTATWDQHFAVQPPTNLPTFLLRFPSLASLNITIPPGNTLASLSRSLAPHNVAVLVLGIEGTNAAGEEADMVPVPSVRGLTIALHSPDYDQACQLFALIPTVFPRLSHLLLLDCRSQVSNAPSGAPFSATDDEPAELARFAAPLLAAYPPETQPVKYQLVQSFLQIVRQINSIFPTIKRTFKIDGHPQDAFLRLPSQQ